MKKRNSWVSVFKSATNAPQRVPNESPTSQAKTSRADLIASLQSALYEPCRRYFETIISGSLLTIRCITSWILAESQDKEYKKVYRFIARIGERVDKIRRKLLLRSLESRRLFPYRITPVERVINDSPIKRYGRKVEGADRTRANTPALSKRDLLGSFLRYGRDNRERARYPEEFVFPLVGSFMPTRTIWK